MSASAVFVETAEAFVCSEPDVSVLTKVSAADPVVSGRAYFPEFVFFVRLDVEEIVYIQPFFSCSDDRDASGCSSSAL